MTEITLSLGSNIEPQRYFQKALHLLAQAFETLEISPIYECEAVGFSGPRFLNAVVCAQTSQSIESVLACLKAIETACDRSRTSQKFDQRTMDIDLLLFDQEVRQVPVLLPREDITRYAFVLKPLADLRPDAIHPVLGKSYLTLWTQSGWDAKTLHQTSLNEA
jgi:2-amino-4-hydroxy-6-hydroxymethyldihydropteridine diphosphokinase